MLNMLNIKCLIAKVQHHAEISTLTQNEPTRLPKNWTAGEKITFLFV